MLSGNALKVLNLINENVNEFEKLRKSTRLPEKILSGIIEELKNGEFIVEEGNSYKITKKGIEELKKLKI
uniref:ArnR1-like winged helix-turn-helix domain-containing protein n=1 Tax=Geoglobus ahangari TaxID=113653 RepID=A0A7C3UKA1_9EURY